MTMTEIRSLTLETRLASYRRRQEERLAKLLRRANKAASRKATR